MKGKWVRVWCHLEEREDQLFLVVGNMSLLLLHPELQAALQKTNCDAHLQVQLKGGVVTGIQVPERP